MWRCILLKFYIKPQRSIGPWFCASCCILLKFYIKPQLYNDIGYQDVRCILLKFYIKPQPLNGRFILLLVVSYWNSTSNHNQQLRVDLSLALYLIEILHQTTTLKKGSNFTYKLYLIEILHQTTTLVYLRRHPP